MGVAFGIPSATVAAVPGAPTGGWQLDPVAGRRYKLTVTVQLGPDRLVLTADVLVAPFAGGAGG